VHAGFALRHPVHFDLNPHLSTRAHLARRTSQAGSAHILNANDGAGLHGFETSFEQQLFQKRIANLHIWTLRLRLFAELFAGHGCAVNTVAACLRAHVNHGITHARGLRIKNLVFANQPERERIHQRVSRVAGLELGFSANIGNTKAVTVMRNPADHAFKDRVIAVNIRLCGLAGFWGARALAVRLWFNRPKPERIHYSYRPRAHGEDVTKNSANARCRSLKRFNKRRVIVRFDLESARPAVADVDDSRILPGPLQHMPAARGKPLQVHSRRFVRAVLAPHHAENSEFGQGRLAAAEQRFDTVVFFRSESMFTQDLWSDVQGGSSHVGKLYCRIFGQVAKAKSISPPRTKSAPNFRRTGRSLL